VCTTLCNKTKKSKGIYWFVCHCTWVWNMGQEEMFHYCLCSFVVVLVAWSSILSISIYLFFISCSFCLLIMQFCPFHSQRVWMLGRNDIPSEVTSVYASTVFYFCILLFPWLENLIWHSSIRDLLLSYVSDHVTNGCLYDYFMWTCVRIGTPTTSGTALKVSSQSQNFLFRRNHYFHLIFQ
jgi:hypothetical protein